MIVSKLVFSVAFAFVDEDVSPNIGTKDRINDYLRSLCVCLASVRKLYPEDPIRVFTNLPIPEEFLTVLRKLNVENPIIPFNHVAPAGMLDRFQSCLFTIDVISVLDHDSCHVLLDPDIVMVRHLPIGIEESESILALPISYGLDDECNGLSLRQQIAWQASYGVLNPHEKHFGGEFYVIPGSKIPNLTSLLEEAWQFSLKDFVLGKPYCHTEEHLMNYALNYIEVSDALEIVARIWTTFRYRRIPANYKELSLWHLPAEKGYGFNRLFKLMEEPESWLWKSNPHEFLLRMARSMNLSQCNLVFRLKRIHQQFAPNFTKKK